MDRSFSGKFLEIARDSDYQLSKLEREALKSLDHLETLRPFMDWFTEFINSDHCLTRDELRMFEELEDENIVHEEEDLNNALDDFFVENAQLFDEVVNEADFRFIEEECIENETTTQELKQLQLFLRGELKKIKDKAETPKSKERNISKELSKIVAGLLELNTCLNNMLNTLYVTWNKLKRPLEEFDENDCDGQFLNLQSMLRYKNESANFKKHLTDYFKFKFGNEIKSNTIFTESLVHHSTPIRLNKSVIASNNREKKFPQVKCKKLIQELECVKEHIKINREDKALASADDLAYSIALEQMNQLIESFSNGMKLSISDVKLETIELSEKVAANEEKLCELTEALTLNSDRLSEATACELLQEEQLSRLRRQEKKLEDINKLMTFIEKRLHCDDYLMCFLENELLNVEVTIKFIDDVLNQAGLFWDEIQRDRENLMSQEDLLKEQAVQLCKAHPLISTLSRMYKLKKESESNDITSLIYTIEVQNKIITDVSYQLAHLYNLGGNKNGQDSISYMRELTNYVQSGKARQPVSNINKAMVPVSSVGKQIDDLKVGFEHQKKAFEEHIEYLTCKPHYKLEQSLSSLFLLKRLSVRELINEAEKRWSERRKGRSTALTYKT